MVLITSCTMVFGVTAVYLIACMIGVSMKISMGYLTLDACLRKLVYSQAAGPISLKLSVSLLYILIYGRKLIEAD